VDGWTALVLKQRSGDETLYANDAGGHRGSGRASSYFRPRLRAWLSRKNAPRRRILFGGGQTPVCLSLVERGSKSGGLAFTSRQTRAEAQNGRRTPSNLHESPIGGPHVLARSSEPGL
jgi:hypothetical protein